jgi:iron complex outermembrane recepter protein
VDLPGGPLQYAVGFQFVKESLTDRPDAQQQAGNVFGSIAQAAVDANRTHKGVFAELAIPITKTLEAQVAVRRDQYPGQGQTSPKVAMKWTPASSFAIRASYAESFLAPSLKQLFGGQDEGAESTSDPLICAAFPTISGTCNNFPYKEISGSNPNLKPETGKTLNIGFIFEPVNAVAVGIDFWRIQKKDEIGTLTVESAVEQGNFATVNGEGLVFVNNANVAATENQGVDLDFRVRVGDTPFGRLTIRNAATYYEKISQQFEPGDPFERFEGTFLNPRWRNNFSANLERGPWSSTFTIRSTAHMWDTQLAQGSFSRSERKVGTFEEVDVNVQYTGIKNLQLSGTVRNLLDRQPPFAYRGTLNQNGSLGFPWIYSPRGRFFSLVANYKFF